MYKINLQGNSCKLAMIWNAAVISNRFNVYRICYVNIIKKCFKKEKNILQHNYSCNNKHSLTDVWFKAVTINAWAQRSNSYTVMFDLTT